VKSKQLNTATKDMGTGKSPDSNPMYNTHPKLYYKILGKKSAYYALDFTVTLIIKAIVLPRILIALILPLIAICFILLSS